MILIFQFFRDMEKEKLKLWLKHVPSRRLPKVLAWLHKLLQRIPRGEQLARELAAQQRQLLTDSCGDSIATPLRLDLHNMQERISSLRAGLLTWQDHLRRVTQLLAEAEQLAAAGSAAMENPRQLVETALPGDMGSVHADLLMSKVCVACSRTLVKNSVLHTYYVLYSTLVHLAL